MIDRPFHAAADGLVIIPVSKLPNEPTFNPSRPFMSIPTAKPFKPPNRGDCRPIESDFFEKEEVLSHRKLKAIRWKESKVDMIAKGPNLVSPDF